MRTPFSSSPLKGVKGPQKSRRSLDTASESKEGTSTGFKLCKSIDKKGLSRRRSSRACKRVLRSSGVILIFGPFGPWGLYYSLRIYKDISEKARTNLPALCRLALAYGSYKALIY